ncbi:MAG: transporter substrate-binding domain-containing protein [Proteobacteria bacterium]|nr:transporter substrate-binding domain-containing protein [Pseudomonadota bacterium]
MPRHVFRHVFHHLTVLLTLLTLIAAPVSAATVKTLRYFPVGSIYDYRWQLLDLALAHTRDGGSVRLQALAEDVTQNRGIELIQAGAIDVVAVGTNAEREQKLLPIRIDILRGMVGYRIFIIRAADQARIAAMNGQDLRQHLVFGLNSQWADLPIMQADGFTVETSTSYENLFGMLAAGRFDAFPRGINEAAREMNERKSAFPQLAVEQTKALYFPYPIYFWVRRDNVALARRIERGLKLALADGSFRKLFETYHAAEIAAMKQEKRQVIRLHNPILSQKDTAPDTSWWWRQPLPETPRSTH